jgi:hypothetical protein
MSLEELEERLSRKERGCRVDAPTLLVFNDIEEMNDYMLKDVVLFNEKIYLCYAKDELLPDMIDTLNFTRYAFMW